MEEISSDAVVMLQLLPLSFYVHFFEKDKGHHCKPWDQIWEDHLFQPLLLASTLSLPEKP